MRNMYCFTTKAWVKARWSILKVFLYFTGEIFTSAILIFSVSFMNTVVLTALYTTSANRVTVGTRPRQNQKARKRTPWRCAGSVPPAACVCRVRAFCSLAEWSLRLRRRPSPGPHFRRWMAAYARTLASLCGCPVRCTSKACRRLVAEP